MSPLNTAFAAALLMTFAAPAALADIAPPPGYVEACTIANYAVDGKQCIKCGDAYHGERDACSKVYEPKGYTRACKTRGASTWSEVWCTTGKKPAGDTAKPADEPVKPAGDTAKPAGDSIKPAGDTAKPAGDTAAKKPAGDTAKVPAAANTASTKTQEKSGCQGGDTPAPWLLALLLLAVPLRRLRLQRG